MVFLSPSTTESIFAFSTADGSDAFVLDIKGVYVLVDGGAERLGFLDSLRTPTAAIVSTATPSSLTNAMKMNENPDSVVAVVGNLPSAASLKDAPAAQPLRELYKTLSVPPIVAQLKGAKPEPLVIHKGLSSGTLSVYTLAGDAKDAEAVAKVYQSGSTEAIEAAAAAGSSVLLIVWQPAREDAPIKRILHLGSAPLARIQQALDRARCLPFLQSAIASAASLKAKPAASAAGGASSRPAAARAASATRPAAKPAAAPTRAAPSSARTAAAPTARAAPAARTAAAPAATKPSVPRGSLPTRPSAPAAAKPAAPSSSATRPTRTTTAPVRPAARAARPVGAAAAGGVKEEVAKKTVVSKSNAAPSSFRPSARSTPNGSTVGTPSKSGAPSAAASPAVKAAAPAAAAAVATATVITAAVLAPTGAAAESAADAAAAVAPAISVSLDEEEGGEEHSTPGGLPVPASPTIIPATPQPPMSPEPMDEQEEAPEQEKHGRKEDEEEQKEDKPAVATDTHEEEETEDEKKEEDQPPHPLPSAPSVDEPECVKELVEEEPQPAPVPAPEEPKEEHHDDPYKPTEPEPAVPAVPEPAPVAPVDPTPPAVGDLLGDFDEVQPVQPQQPGDDGLLDSLEEPMKKMQISMDTDKLAEELGLTGGGKGEGEETTEENLLDLTQASLMDNDLDKTLNTSVVESASELDTALPLLSPTKEKDVNFEDLQRKLSEQAEESLLAAAAAPFIAGLASTVVEAATIDGAKSTLESLISANNRGGVESPTGDKLLSFRSSGFENPDEPKEVKYEETDPAIDDVLTKLADESDMVNGGGAVRHVELNGHGDTTENGHHQQLDHMVNGSGWPEGTTMHLPPTTTGAAAAKSAPKFKLAGPVHVDMVTVPHRGTTILLNDEAASLEFFSSVRSSLYILQSGGEVAEHVLTGWMKGKGAWAANVPSRLVPTHHNDTVNRWTAAHTDELTELGLSVATPIDLTTLTYPDGQAKACTLTL